LSTDDAAERVTAMCESIGQTLRSFERTPFSESSHEFMSATSQDRDFFNE
jgi:hypothetical protein